MKNTSRYRLFYLAMIFTFSWVIVGDLIAMHIEVIYGIDIQQHQPYSKTQKSGKKNFKVNTKKSSDHSKSLGFDCISKDYSEISNFRNETDLLFGFVSQAYTDSKSKLTFGRAPPCL